MSNKIRGQTILWESYKHTLIGISKRDDSGKETIFENILAENFFKTVTRRFKKFKFKSIEVYILKDHNYTQHTKNKTSDYPLSLHCTSLILIFIFHM